RDAITSNIADSDGLSRVSIISVHKASRNGLDEVQVNKAHDISFFLLLDVDVKLLTIISVIAAMVISGAICGLIVPCEELLRPPETDIIALIRVKPLVKIIKQQ